MIHDLPKDSSPLFDVQKCAVCGCTDDCACPGGCYWVADDLCSQCADKMLGALCEDCIRNTYAKVEPYCRHGLSHNCEGSCEQELNPDEAPCAGRECAYKEQCLSALIAGYQLRYDLLVIAPNQPAIEEEDLMIEEDMSRHIKSNYHQDNLDKRVCRSCDRPFIVGEDISKGLKIRCPYCGSFDVDEYAIVDNNELLDALGCGGIYFYTGETPMEEDGV